MFEINQRVCLRTDENLRGRIDFVHQNNNYDIIWDNGDIETINSSLIQREVLELSPWDRLAENDFDNFQNFTISSIINKIRNTSANTISTLKASKTIFKPYQFIPLLKLLQSDKKRIIVADEVGLGKTITAGHIILELAARGELKNLLVVCLNSIQEKWVDELENKFNIRVNIFKSVQDFKEALKSSIENGEEIFGVINYSKFRNKKNIEFFLKNAIEFDLLIFDEAHTLRNDKTNARKSLKAFTNLAKAIVMLTATPIMTSLENLYNLVKLIDEDNYSNYQIFQNAININKPFIKAYNQLNEGVDNVEIGNELKATKVESFFKYGDYEYKSISSLEDVLKEDQLYKSLLHKLFNTKEMTPAIKAKLQEMLINLNSLNHFYTRTQKKQVNVQGNVVKRNPRVIAIEMNNSERDIYEAIMNTIEEGIGGIQIKRKYSSSLFASKFEEDELNNMNINFDFVDGKYSALLDIIQEQNDRQIIVFAFFRKTLLYLKHRLKNQGINVELIYGGIGIEDRNEIIKRFKNNEFQILLSSEVGSTGLDMQFCDCIVNYDLPWNPMVVEQRIGRIDRIGQKSKVINIFNFIYKETIEQKIYYRLYDRIKLFEESLGNLDEILGKEEMYIEKTIEKLFKRDLSEEEIEKILDQSAEAIETNILQREVVTEGLKDAFSNDLYFSNEINAIEKNRQYITEDDLIEFINRGISNILTTLTFIQDEDNPFIYNITQPNVDVIFNFIQEQYDSGSQELFKMLQKFKIKNRERTIKCTFNQKFAFENKEIEYISVYHPLINAISNYFHHQKLDRNSVFRFALEKSKINDSQFNKGFYFLIKFEIEITKLINGRKHVFNHLRSMVIDLNGDGDFTILEKNEAEKFSTLCQHYKINMPKEGIINFKEEFMGLIRKKYSEYVLKERELLEHNERLKFESELNRKTKQETDYLDKRIARLEENIEQEKGLEAIQKTEIKELKDKREKLLKLNKESKLKIKSKLITLNLIYLYG